MPRSNDDGLSEGRTLIEPKDRKVTSIVANLLIFFVSFYLLTSSGGGDYRIDTGRVRYEVPRFPRSGALLFLHTAIFPQTSRTGCLLHSFVPMLSSLSVQEYLLARRLRMGAALPPRGNSLSPAAADRTVGFPSVVRRIIPQKGHPFPVCFERVNPDSFCFRRWHPIFHFFAKRQKDTVHPGTRGGSPADSRASRGGPLRLAPLSDTGSIRLCLRCSFLTFGSGGIGALHAYLRFLVASSELLELWPFRTHRGNPAVSARFKQCAEDEETM